jgi:protease IV
MITDGVGSGGTMLGARSFRKILKSVERDRRSSAIVLHVDSPGGSATGSELMLEELERLALKRPVIVFCDRVAASGGYMLSLAGREIWATPHAVLGSIGVFAGKFNTSGLLGKLGVHRTLITRGENSGVFSSSRPFTASERRALELNIDQTYESFLELVAKGRKKTRDEVHALGEGRVFSGTRALSVGLVDRLGGFEDACRRALELAGKPADGFELKAYNERRGRMGALSLFQSLSEVRMYALWTEALTWEGLW